MELKWNRQRTYAALIGIGIWAVLYRVIAMFTDGSIGILMPWAAALLSMELALDISTFVAAIWWWWAGTELGCPSDRRLRPSYSMRYAVPSTSSGGLERGGTSIDVRSIGGFPRRSGGG